MKYPGLIWKVYFALYLYIILHSLYAFFSPAMPAYWYYQTLLAYSGLFLVPYLLNLISLFFNGLALVALFLFISRKPLGPERFWSYAFVLRAIFDVFGKSYEQKVLQSLFYVDVNTAWISIAMMVALVMPSYIAFYLYAFEREKVLSRGSSKPQG